MSKFQKVIEKLDTLKSMFSDETEVVANVTNDDANVSQVTEKKFEDVSLLDGTVLTYEGELVPGTAVFVKTEDGEEIPAPEGTHELAGLFEGVSIVLDAEGIIVEVVDERTEGEEVAEVEEVEEEMSSDNVETIIDNKLSEIETPLNAIVTGIESILERNANLQSELNELKSQFNSFKNEPTDQKEQSKFSTADNKDKRAEYFKNIIKNR